MNSWLLTLDTETSRTGFSGFWGLPHRLRGENWGEEFLIWVKRDFRKSLEASACSRVVQNGVGPSPSWHTSNSDLAGRIKVPTQRKVPRLECEWLIISTSSGSTVTARDVWRWRRWEFWRAFCVVNFYWPWDAADGWIVRVCVGARRPPQCVNTCICTPLWFSFILVNGKKKLLKWIRVHFCLSNCFFLWFGKSQAHVGERCILFAYFNNQDGSEGEAAQTW